MKPGEKKGESNVKRNSKNMARVITAGWILALLTFALALPVAASPILDPSATDDPQIDIGADTPHQTDVGVAVSKANPRVLSVEVPLYVTMAVTKDGAGPGKTGLTLPKHGYRIRNNTYSSDGSLAPVCVTGMSISGVGSGGLWSIVESVNNASTQRNMSLSIGGVSLPPVSASDTASVPANIHTASSVFYDMSVGKYRPVDITGRGQELPIAGTVPEAYNISDSATATPQFKVKYTLALLNAAGEPVGETTVP